MWLVRSISMPAHQGRKLAAAAQSTQRRKLATVGTVGAIVGMLLVAAIRVFI
jgi:hypothetical protein